MSAAPKSDLATACAEIDRLHSELVKLQDQRATIDRNQKLIQNLIAQVHRQENELQDMRFLIKANQERYEEMQADLMACCRALSFYAAKDTYDAQGFSSLIEQDRGGRAKTALDKFFAV
jgi:chromosome segregation ATPase